jgi:Rad3-related DNA helicase
MNIDITNDVIILDEAHNLEKNCTESSSFDLTPMTLASSISEVQKVIHSFQSDSNVLDEEFKAKVPKVLEKLLDLEKEIQLIDFKQAKDLTTKGDFILELFGNASFNNDNFVDFAEVVDKILEVLSDDKELNGSFLALNELSKILNLLFANSQDGLADSYKCFVKVESSTFKQSGLKKQLYEEAGGSVKDFNTAKTLSFWCLTASVTMKVLTNLTPRCFILTSGTLSPMDSMAYELGMDFQVVLENPHVVGDDQIAVIVARRGPNGVVLNSSFKNRGSIEYKDELGHLAIQVAQVVPGGMLVFFPSYVTLNECITCWKNTREGDSSLWDILNGHKPIFMEPKESFLLSKSFKDYEAAIDGNPIGGAIYLAVCRGKASEGIDFSNKYGRAVLITGLPYPPHQDAKVRLKMEFLDDLAKRVKSTNPSLIPLTGAEWYNQQSSRAVNQAVGRVLRSRYDYGAIILADERFATQKEQLSKWLRPHIKVSENFGNINRFLTKFFNKATTEFGRDSEKLILKLNGNGKDPKKDVVVSLSDPQMIESDKPVQVISVSKREYIQVEKDVESVTPMKQSPIVTPVKQSPVFTVSTPIRQVTKTPKDQTPSTPLRVTPIATPPPVLKPMESPKTPTGVVTPEKYVMMVRDSISRPEYDQFKEIVRNFSGKKSNEYDPSVYSDLTLKIKKLLSKAKENQHDLIEGFKRFVPREFQSTYDTIQIPSTPEVKAPGKRGLEYDLLEGKMKKKMTSPIVQKPEKIQAFVDLTDDDIVLPEKKTVEKEKTENVGDAKTKCPICLEDFKSPAASHCGHICCLDCWESWLDRKLECPCCKKMVRKSHLVKLFNL